MFKSIYVKFLYKTVQHSQTSLLDRSQMKIICNAFVKSNAIRFILFFFQECYRLRIQVVIKISFSIQASRLQAQ